MEAKKMFGIKHEKGLIRGVKNGVVGRVDKMFATVLLKLLRELKLEATDEDIKKAEEGLVVKVNNKDELVYKNYYINEHKVMCIRDDNILIGEIEMSDAEAVVMMNHISKEVVKEQDKAPAKRKPAPRKTEGTKTEKTEKPTRTVKSEEEPIRRKRKVREAPKSEFEDETKEILKTLTPEIMEEKGFSFISAEDYAKNKGNYR